MPAGMFRSEVEKILKKAGIKEITLETPPPEIGADLAFPCFSLAKKLRKSPAEIAKDIVGKSRPSSLVKTIEPSGPYVNFHADWAKLGNLLLKEILDKGKKFCSGLERGTILVEFAHPNTHKAFHIGHVRNICLGESLSRILDISLEIILN